MYTKKYAQNYPSNLNQQKSLHPNVLGLIIFIQIHTVGTFSKFLIYLLILSTKNNNNFALTFFKNFPNKVKPVALSSVINLVSYNNTHTMGTFSKLFNMFSHLTSKSITNFALSHH